MKYWAWPTRTDEAMTYDHLTKNSEEGEMWRRLRFDGHASFEWSRMADSNKWYTTTPKHESIYDLRGNVAESNRFATALLLLYVDVLSTMNFATGASGTRTYAGSTKRRMSRIRTCATCKSVRSVSAASSLVQDGFYRECARGTDLVGETWLDTNAVNRAGMRFFRVRVGSK